VQLLRIGEEGGRLEDMLVRVADIYDREVAESARRLLAALEPALIVILGTLIGGVVVSLLSAIVTVNDLPL
jgi:general secretion pathway protein F